MRTKQRHHWVGEPVELLRVRELQETVVSTSVGFPIFIDKDRMVGSAGYLLDLFILQTSLLKSTSDWSESLKASFRVRPAGRSALLALAALAK